MSKNSKKKNIEAFKSWFEQVKRKNKTKNLAFAKK